MFIDNNHLALRFMKQRIRKSHAYGPTANN